MTSGPSLALFTTFEKSRRKAVRWGPHSASRNASTNDDKESPWKEASLPFVELVAMLRARSIRPPALLFCGFWGQMSEDEGQRHKWSLLGIDSGRCCLPFTYTCHITREPAPTPQLLR